MKSLLSREKLQQEIEDEIQSHLEFEMRKNRRLGMSATEARRHAHLALGGTVQTVEECRDQRGIPFLENVVRDGRHALRAFRRAPALAFAVILTIGLGVGANTTVFAFCKAMLLATLPVPNPQQLYLVSIEVPDNPPYPYFSFPDLQKIQKRQMAQHHSPGLPKSSAILCEMTPARPAQSKGNS